MQSNAMLAFRPAVHFVLRGLGRVGIYDVEELENELWLKLCEIWPRVQTVAKSKRFSFVVQAFRNHALDLLGREARRNQGVTHTEPAFEIENAIREELLSIQKVFSRSQSNPDEIYEGTELVETLRRWAEEEGGQIQQLIEEILDPSEETKATWAEMLKEPGYKMKDYGTAAIPPMSLAKIIQVTPSRWSEKRKRLEAHLKQGGYAL